jgi:hypothetical protein
VAVHPPIPQTSAAWRARRERLGTLVHSDEWRLVSDGLRSLQRQAMLAVATGKRLSESEIREQQARYELITELLSRPLETLMQFYKEGDDR